VGRRRKLLGRILSGRSDTNIPFEQLRTLLRHLGFEERIRGSHHVFTKEDVPELLDLQTTKEATAKPYQVKQVRELLTRYKIPE
jgi:hypothetical protein